MKKPVLTFLIVFLPVSFTGSSLLAQTTYYVSNSGSDSNSGTSPASPWKTITKLNTAMGSLRPGSKVLLKRGDVFRDDYIRCQSLVNATPAMTLASTPPACSGAPGAPILISSYGTGELPILDGADPLTGKWKQLRGAPTVWQLSGVTTPPIKIYVDGDTRLTTALTPVPNSQGVFVPGRTYNQLDGVQVDNRYYVNGIPGRASSAGRAVNDYTVWRNVTNATPTCTATETFSPTRSGIENVQAIGNGSWQVYLSVDGVCAGKGYADTTAFTSSGGGPRCSISGNMFSVNGKPSRLEFTSDTGCASQPQIVLTNPTGKGVTFVYRQDKGSWYWDGSTIILQLEDGGDPNTHSIEATHRPYGVLLESSNYVNVDRLAVEHTQHSGILNMVYSSDQKGGDYFTGEYHSFTNNKIWNTTSMSKDARKNQDGGAVLQEADLAVSAYSSGGMMHQLRGILVDSNTLLDADQTSGQRGPVAVNLQLFGIDGGSAANNTVAHANVMRNPDGICLYYTSANPGHGANLGGRIWGNTATNCGSGAYFFGSTIGGRLDHNLAKDGTGEGIQLGGPLTTSSEAVPQRIDHNQIINFGKAPSSVGFNGIDCNGIPGTNTLLIDHNTIFNVNSAALTFESPGCYGAHVFDNVVDQYAHLYQPGAPNYESQINPSGMVYITKANGSNGFTNANWHHNIWVPGSNIHPFGGAFSCQEFLATIPDRSSACYTGSPNGSVLGFNDEAAGDLSLTPASLLRGSGYGGMDRGALPFGAKDVRQGVEQPPPRERRAVQ